MSQTPKTLTIKADETQLGKPLHYDEELYLEVREFIEQHLDLVEDAEYDILTAKVFESWMIWKFKSVGYIFFVGPPRSGKTRGLETLSTLCYNPKMAAYMTTAAIYRILNAEWSTLFLDEIQQYLDVEKATFMAVLNAGQRRGSNAIILVQKDGEWIPQDFDVFGSKFMASTEDTAKALATRCIIIAMIKNARSVPLRIDEKRAEKLREKLNLYATKASPQKLPDITNMFLETGFRDYRNIETFINLVTLTPPVYRKRIINYAKSIDDQIAEEEGLNFYSDIYGAIKYVYEKSTGGKIAIGDIVEAYNEGRPEQEKTNPRSVGSTVNIMGLRRKCRMTGGRMGRYISDKLMKRLSRRYNPPPPQKTLGGSDSENRE